MIDFTLLTRKLILPEGFVAPRRLVHEDIVATVLTRDDLADDVAGINASLDLIRRTRGGDWPTEEVTEEFDYLDLVWHECEFREGFSYSYVVRDDRRTYLGCAYLYPMGRRTPLDEQRLAHDVDVSWWVTPDAYAKGYYTKLHTALQKWTTVDYPFTNPWYSNAEI